MIFNVLKLKNLIQRKSIQYVDTLQDYKMCLYNLKVVKEVYIIKMPPKVSDFGGNRINGVTFKTFYLKKAHVFLKNFLLPILPIVRFIIFSNHYLILRLLRNEIN